MNVCWQIQHLRGAVLGQNVQHQKSEGLGKDVFLVDIPVSLTTYIFMRITSLRGIRIIVIKQT